MNNDQATRQLGVLFDEADIVAFKHKLDAWPTYEPSEQTPFFCVNALKAPGKLVTENIASYRNILVEMDVGGIEAQWDKVEAARLPWSSCVYSGGKSLHFIVSLKGRGIASAEDYSTLVREICYGLGADISAANPNRLSRLAGAVRDNGVVQELIEVRERVDLADLVKWRNEGAPTELRTSMDSYKASILKKTHKVSYNPNASTTMPPVFRAMLHDGVPHPKATTSRHQSLVMFATWLKANWHKPEEIEELLEGAAISMGIGGRGDVGGIMRWLR
jgi:hypothetical protein